MKHRNLVAAAIAAALVLGPGPLALAQTHAHGAADAHGDPERARDIRAATALGMGEFSTR